MHAVNALPNWLPEETWSAFVEMRRKTLKKPATDFALMLILKELYKLRDLGHDPLACLEQSIVQGWADVYPLKAKKAERAAVSAFSENQAKLKEEEVRARGIDKNDLAENARKARERFHRPRPDGETLQ